MSQGIAAQNSRSRNFVKYALDIACANLPHPKAQAATLQVIRPDISIALYSGWSLLLFHARQINPLNEINERYGCFGCTVRLVSLGECRFRQLSSLGLGDCCKDTVDVLSHRCDLLCDSDSFHLALNDASVEITDV